MKLDRDGPMPIKVPKNTNLSLFGMPSRLLREMLAELIEQGLVNGNASAMDDDRDGADTAHNIAMLSRVNDLNALRLGHSVTFRIGHKGRVRLFQLRDELRADRGREQFGILLDRRAWDRELALQLLFATKDAPLSLLYVDLDHFKQVNDGISHDEGDRVLKRCMEIVRDMVGDHGDAFRIGGDELGGVLPTTPLDEAVRVAETIRQTVEAEFREAKVAVTTSIGVAAFTGAVDPLTASKFADAKMYDAKLAGRNCVKAAAFTSTP